MNADFASVSQFECRAGDGLLFCQVASSVAPFPVEACVLFLMLGVALGMAFHRWLLRRQRRLAPFETAAEDPSL